MLQFQSFVTYSSHELCDEIDQLTFVLKLDNGILIKDNIIHGLSL